MDRTGFSWSKWFPVFLLLGMAGQRCFDNLFRAINHPELFAAFGKILIISPIVWAGALTIAFVLVIVGLLLRNVSLLRIGSLASFAVWIVGGIAALSVGSISGFLMPCSILFLFFGYLYINARTLTRVPWEWQLDRQRKKYLTDSK